MFASSRALTHALDEALALAGFTSASGSFVQRRYQGTLGGAPASAEISVMVATHDTPSGYVLTFETTLPLRTRWVAGRSIPLLLRSGLTVVGAPKGGELLRADDAGWARRFVERPDALIAVLRSATFVEQRPTGQLQVQLQSLGSTQLTDLRALVEAIGAVVAISLAPPLPREAKPRWTDNRALAMVVLTLVVLGTLGGLGVGVWLLVR